MLSEHLNKLKLLVRRKSEFNRYLTEFKRLNNFGVTGPQGLSCAAMVSQTLWTIVNQNETYLQLAPQTYEGPLRMCSVALCGNVRSGRQDHSNFEDRRFMPFRTTFLESGLEISNSIRDVVIWEVHGFFRVSRSGIWTRPKYPSFRKV